MLLYVPAFSFTVFDPPSWSEEVGWLEISKTIAQGVCLNPVLPRSDYPSSFQAWFVALLLEFTGRPLIASRLAGLLYCALALFCFSLRRRSDAGEKISSPSGSAVRLLDHADLLPPHGPARNHACPDSHFRLLVLFPQSMGGTR